MPQRDDAHRYLHVWNSNYTISIGHSIDGLNPVPYQTAPTSPYADGDRRRRGPSTAADTNLVFRAMRRRRGCYIAIVRANFATPSGWCLCNMSMQYVYTHVHTHVHGVHAHVHDVYTRLLRLIGGFGHRKGRHQKQRPHQNAHKHFRNRAQTFVAKTQHVSM